MTTMPHGTVTLEVAERIATLTLRRPDQLNAMTDGLMEDVTAAVRAAEADDDVRVLVVTGEGRGFCAGADLADSAGILDTAGDREEDPGEAATRTMDDVFHPAILAVHECRVPTIARINGVVAGGGLGLAMAADVSIAARSAFFVATFGPRLGIVPDLGTTWHLARRAGRARALGMAMLGDRITADEAVEFGLIYRAVDDDLLDEEVARAAGILRHSSNEAMRRIRDAVDRAPHGSLAEQLEVERAHQRVLIPMNMMEGALAFVEKRDPRFTT